MKAYLIHGFESNPHKNWFDWLKKELSYLQIPLTVLEMPNPDHPVWEDWIQTLNAQIALDEKSSENVILISHSLGTFTSASFLAECSYPVFAAIFVAGFGKRIPRYPILDTYTSHKIDFKKSSSMAIRKVVFASPEDTYVPFQHSEELAFQLKAKFISVPNAGHFMDSDGYASFSLLLTEIKNLLPSQH